MNSQEAKSCKQSEEPRMSQKEQKKQIEKNQHLLNQRRVQMLYQNSLQTTPKINKKK